MLATQAGRAFFYYLSFIHFQSPYLGRVMWKWCEPSGSVRKNSDFTITRPAKIHMGHMLPLCIEWFPNVIHCSGGCHKKQAGEMWCCNYGRKMVTSTASGALSIKSRDPACRILHWEKHCLPCEMSFWKQGLFPQMTLFTLAARKLRAILEAELQHLGQACGQNGCVLLSCDLGFPLIFLIAFVLTPNFYLNCSSIHMFIRSLVHKASQILHGIK